MQHRLQILPNLEAAIEAGFPIFRHQLAPPLFGIATHPLISGTEEFTNDGLVYWHAGLLERHPRDIACYYMTDVTVAGFSTLWLGEYLVTSPEIMPPYLNFAFDIENGGAEGLHICRMLPVRTIDRPCLIALGAGTQVYGHFLIEVLFRILIARRAFLQSPQLPFAVLLDIATPQWLFKILAEDLGIGPADIELFSPGTEQVLLRHAYVSTRPFQDYLIHPFANTLIGDLLGNLNIPKNPSAPEKIFVSRRNFHNPAAGYRVCVNEANLVSIAEARHGFTSVALETMAWREQIALFQKAKIIPVIAASDSWGIPKESGF
jgi:hypothetical protein